MLTTITQDYEDNYTHNPELFHPGNQWKEDTVEVMPLQSPHFVQHAICVSLPRGGISQVALNIFMVNLYMQEFQQNIASISKPTEMEEINTCVVHSVTNETVTEYTQLSLTHFFKTIG